MKENRKQIVLSAIMAIIFIFITATHIDAFSNRYDSLVGFLPDNHSNSITSANPARIDIEITNDYFDYCYLVFTPSSELSENTTLTITMTTQSGEQLFRQDFKGGNLFRGYYININPESEIPKGTKCSILIETDAVTEETGYRMLLGQSLKNEISAWYNGEIEETGASKPELHVIYPQHFGTNTFIVYCICLLMMVVLPLIPKFKFEEKLTYIVSFAAVPASAAIILYFIEVLSNSSIRYLPPKVLLCNYLIILGIELLLVLITGRPHVAVVITAVFGFVAGLANHFVLMYRGTVIVPIDIIALGAAKDVISHYTFSLDISVMLSAAVLGAGCVVAARYGIKLNIRRLLPAVIRVLCGVIACAVLILSCAKSSLEWSGAVVYFKDATEFARMNGFVYSFVQTMHNIVMEEPENYNSERVTEIMNDFTGTQGTDVQPDIILIMSETWADLTTITDISSFSTDPMPYLHTIKSDNNPNTVVGRTVVPVFGSGTCNSEFESITGFSMANFSSYCFPYLQYIDDSTPSIPDYLKEQGYKTYALHPGETSTWARDRVYNYFNFDEIYFAENFPYQDTRHEMISDGACFNSILDLLPDNNSEEPAFIFNVTIANHGGYTKNTDFDIKVTIGNTEGQYSDAERFNSLMLYSDEELQQFISQLEKRERPTVLVMFGDHLPSLSDEYFAYIHMEQTEVADPLARYTTPYLIWSNYDTDTSEIPERISSNYMGLVAMKLAGVPLNGWYSYLESQMEHTPVYSLYGVQDAQGNYVDMTNYDYQDVQYALFRKSSMVPKEFYNYK